MPFQTEAPILAHDKVGHRHYRLRLHAPCVAEAAGPGQFVQMLYRQPFGPPMRRPFSIHDTDGEAFDVIYVARGPFTTGMAELAPGDTVSVVGPLGNTFEIMGDAGTRHVLVAGGVGAPPMHFFAKRTLAAMPVSDLTIINGARTADLIVANDDFTQLGVELRVTTDDGSTGRCGTVLDELKDIVRERPSVSVYACGPEPMLKAIAQYCLGSGIPCRVSLETVMPCGTGVCMGCVVKVRSSEHEDGCAYVRACYEGPVFDARDLLWD
ncbi:MAG: dihydroorotate dehydrogenase electron transfer subunit [Armatimonadetes bacterium]|nr:dihydroorotate dehydrogenase electron transfer subunit [Armatimonadota bacterium]